VHEALRYYLPLELLELALAGCCGDAVLVYDALSYLPKVLVYETLSYYLPLELLELALTGCCEDPCTRSLTSL
jgi:hypothetical protein